MTLTSQETLFPPQQEGKPTVQTYSAKAVTVSQNARLPSNAKGLIRHQNPRWRTVAMSVIKILRLDFGASAENCAPVIGKKVLQRPQPRFLVVRPAVETYLETCSQALSQRGNRPTEISAIRKSPLPFRGKEGKGKSYITADTGTQGSL